MSFKYREKFDPQKNFLRKEKETNEIWQRTLPVLGSSIAKNYNLVVPLNDENMKHRKMFSKLSKICEIFPKKVKQYSLCGKNNKVKRVIRLTANFMFLNLNFHGKTGSSWKSCI